MDFAFPANLSLRDALIALVALLALYLLVAFLRMRRLKREKAVAASPVAAQTMVAAYTAVQEPGLKTEPEVIKPEIERREPEPLAAPSDAAFPWNEAPDETPLKRQISLLESEVAQLRREVGGLRAEVLVLREAQQRVFEAAVPDVPEDEPVEEAVDVATTVSPLYSEAMQYALQGFDAAAISQNCGISRAEAELVVALVRNRDI